ncbi:putative small auxin-up RNA [Helianthus annuus]|nr:putative small auxin-up RNA [Helianthus annuus]
MEGSYLHLQVVISVVNGHSDGHYPSMKMKLLFQEMSPKGHLVVYVGNNQRRFVINVKLLKHPLFNALLDQAREEYDFTNDSRLSIPCDEEMFLSVIRCATSPQDRRIGMCL